MKKKLKIAYFGEHDLKNFSYCIDSSIQNNLVREELAKKIHKLQGKITFNISTEVILIIQKTELGMNPLERYKEFTKIYLFHPEGKITFKRYNKDEKAIINSYIEDDENSEVLESNRNNANNEQKLIKNKSVYNNFIDSRLKFFPNKANNFSNLNLNASRGIADPSFNKNSTNINTEELKTKNEELHNTDIISNNNICIEKEKLLRIINLKDIQEVIKGMEKKHISYFYKHGLPEENTPDDTACVIFRGRIGKKKKLEYHCFTNKKTNKLEFPKIDKSAPQGYSLFSFEKESKMVKKILKQKREAKSSRIQNNYDLTTPYPNSENKYCYICNKKLEEFKIHFDSKEHLENLSKISYIGDSLNKTFAKIEKNNEEIFCNSNLNQNHSEIKEEKDVLQQSKHVYDKNTHKNIQLNNSIIQYTALVNRQAINILRNIPILSKPQIKPYNQNDGLSSANKENSYSKTSSPEFDKNNIEKLNNNDKLDSEQNTLRPISSSIYDSNISSNKITEPNNKLANIKENSSSKTYENYNINKISESQTSLENNSNNLINNPYNIINNEKFENLILNENINNDNNENNNICNFENQKDSNNNLVINNHINNINFTVKTRKAIINRNSDILLLDNQEPNEDNFFRKDSIKKKYTNTEINLNVNSNNMLLDNLKSSGCCDSNTNLNNEVCKLNNNNFFSSTNMDKDFTECLSLRGDNNDKPKKLGALDSNSANCINNINNNIKTQKYIRINKNNFDNFSNVVNNKNNLLTELFDLRGNPIGITNLNYPNLKEKYSDKGQNNFFLNKNSFDDLVNSTKTKQDFMQIEEYLKEKLNNKNINLNQNIKKEWASLLIENSMLSEKTQQSKLEISLPFTTDITEESKLNKEKTKHNKKLYLKQFLDEDTEAKLNGLLTQDSLLLGKKNTRSEFELNPKADDNFPNSSDFLNDNVRMTRTKLKDIKHYSEYLKSIGQNLNIEKNANAHNKSDKRLKK